MKKDPSYPTTETVQKPKFYLKEKEKPRILKHGFSSSLVPFIFSSIVTQLIHGSNETA